MLSVVPGMGASKADYVAEKYPSFRKLLKATEEELADIAVAKGRRLGPALAKALYQVAHGA